MDLEEKYKSLYGTIMREHLEVFKRQDIKELGTFLELIKNSKRIFLMGVGREGISTRGFAMRLMHLGKEAHWIWDDTTPGMHEGDLFIATNGSGKIGHITYVVEQAKKAGAKVAVVTGSPHQTCPKLADFTLFVPAAVFNGTDERAVPSVQPMGNLFEQHLYMLFDIIIMMLEDELQVSNTEMEGRHRNIE
ncbi:MAG TPA: 6-phospho-3-hexuloisomerase [Ruminococcaceae bacterium]|nr:6-phospho-3-hexuloisomerase [Oscillospiraceae bacterium]